MGVCCAPGEDLSGPAKDLPEPSTMGVSDVYRVFELGTLFARTQFGHLEQAINKCKGEGTTVSIDALADEMGTGLWLSAKKDGPTRQLLSQSMFQGEDSDISAGTVDAEKLLIFGLLNSVDAKVPIKKARAFFCILQDGGFETHAEIAAGDKDFIPAFKSFMHLTLHDLQEAAKATGGVDAVYDEDELNTIDEAFEDFSELFLEDVFGPRSRMPSEEWCQAVAKGASWVFDPTKMREKIADCAELEKKFN